MNTWRGPIRDKDGNLTDADRPDIGFIISSILQLDEAATNCESTQRQSIYAQCCQDCKDLLLVHMLEFVPSHDQDLTDRAFIFEHILHDLEMSKGALEKSDPEALIAISNSLDILLASSKDDADDK